jgi:hypothetical protein
MADPGFEKVFFDAPFHEVVVDGGFGGGFVEGDGFVVVGVEGGEVGGFKVEFVC